MTYKDSIFEMFMAAQMLFSMEQLYAANVLFCACFELLERANATGRENEIYRVMDELDGCMSEEEERALFEELNRQTGRFRYFEEYKNYMRTKMKDVLVKPNFGKVPFEEMRKIISKNWTVYNQTKHGREHGAIGRFSLDTQMPMTLSHEDVANIEKCVRGAIVMQYPDDVKKRLKI